MGVLSNLGNDLVGNPKKAFLIIHKDTGDALSGTEIAAKTERALTLATAGGAAPLTAATMRASLLTQGLMDYSVLQVQYNPASISLTANATNVPVQYLQQNLDQGIPNQNLRPPAVVLSVDLIFDAVNNKDAFMFEKFRLSATDVAADVAAGLLSKKGFTVQPQTNGLIAMVMRNSTRTVTFKWADMTFTGEVTEISARYTMFSVSGKPIRSMVKLNITQKVEGTADGDYWDKAFDKAFGGKYTPKDSGGKSAADTLGNLINLGL